MYLSFAQVGCSKNNVQAHCGEDFPAIVWSSSWRGIMHKRLHKVPKESRSFAALVHHQLQPL